MRDIPFVDAHVHFWRLDKLSYPWLTPPFGDGGPNGNVAAIADNYLPADYRAEAAGWNVAGFVHVEAGAQHLQAVEETAWVAGLDDAPAGFVAFAALDDPGLRALLDRHAAHDRLRGIRHIVNWHPDPARTYTPRDLTGDEAWRRGFAEIARRGLAFDLQCYPGQMPALATLFARHPEATVVIDHLGMPVLSDPDGERDWRDGLAALARLPQVAIKISGFGFAQRPWTVEDARPFILQAIDLFGTQRCLVASDFPTDRLFGGFDHTLEAYAAVVSDLTECERRALWGDNADRIYRLNLDLEHASHG